MTKGFVDAFMEFSAAAPPAVPSGRTWTIGAETRTWTIAIQESTMKQWSKDPQAVLDYKWDWGSWLAVGETITAVTMTVEPGIVLESVNIVDSARAVTGWVSGGTTVGTTYEITCHVTTSAEREEDATMQFLIKQK